MKGIDLPEIEQKNINQILAESVKVLKASKFDDKNFNHSINFFLKYYDENFNSKNNNLYSLESLMHQYFSNLRNDGNNHSFNSTKTEKDLNHNEIISKPQPIHITSISWNRTEVPLINCESGSKKRFSETDLVNKTSNKASKEIITGRLCDNIPSIQIYESIPPDEKWMNSTPEIISNFLCEKNKYLASLVLKNSKNELEQYSICNVGVPKQSEVLVFGMVRSETDAGFADNSLAIEGISDEDKDKVAQLWLEDVLKYSLFPGKIIGCRGLCTSSTNSVKFSAHEIYDKISLSQLSYEVDEELLKKYNNFPIHICIGSGRFDPDSPFESSPLEILLKYAKKEKPHLLIIFGPLIDIRYLKDPNKMGDVATIYENLFLTLSDLVQQEDNMQIVIVPHPCDAINPRPIPQPRFDILSMRMNQEFSKKLHFVSNPATIKINEVVLAVTSCDILQPLNHFLISKGEKTSRIELLCRQILNQRSFFPMFPPAFPLNYSSLKSLVFDSNVDPNIFLFPSNFYRHPFSQEIDSKIFVKAYNLCDDGTCSSNSFIEILIHPPQNNGIFCKNINTADSNYERFPENQTIDINKELTTLSSRINFFNVEIEHH